ncbi:Oidioi.mRNA.OKI2018_I69.PAR.g10144.t1.cds [Oikopleura dioica]|uniref:Oidioi.mRNA.OKI2018_I69.PAR.g10144.t1.cds n=1 Tax=Oikopleura dioica TaxID=34765 RepID=A0ABN7RP45_OIKDI|nr:Oidioi.mRNA.OKI2018_I69.PAR.g10144.t1.cds [Oikopleura dioica]
MHPTTTSSSTTATSTSTVETTTTSSTTTTSIITSTTAEPETATEEGCGELPEEEESNPFLKLFDLRNDLETSTPASTAKSSTVAPLKITGSFLSSKTRQEVSSQVNVNFANSNEILAQAGVDEPVAELQDGGDSKGVADAAENAEITETINFFNTQTGIVTITIITIIGTCALLILGTAIYRNFRRRKVEIAAAYFGILISLISFLVVIYFLIVDLSTDESHSDEGIQENIAYVLIGITSALILLLSGFILIRRSRSGNSRRRRNSSISLGSSIASHSFLNRPAPKSVIENPFATTRGTSRPATTRI